MLTITLRLKIDSNERVTVSDDEEFPWSFTFSQRYLPGCSRGQPQTVPASQEQTQDQRSLCTTSADSCESEQFKCAQVDGGLQQCCPTREFICSEWGGVQSELFDLQLPTDRLPYSAGSHRLGQMPTTRYRITLQVDIAVKSSHL
ncbi:hypothetical protein GCK32_019805 [Trichostrongylus colubriformis]|uniref:Uncharacterized protein n=1 Tax=Trichostrongylus colubriformis TaxID=6319 RepID=A0AAN8IW84_TRICO